MDVAGGQEVVFYWVHSLTDFHYYHLLCFFYRKTEGNASRVTPAQCRRSSVSTRDFSFPLFPTLHLNSSDPNYFWKWDREQMAPSSCRTCWWQLHCPVLLWSAVSQLELMWAKNSASDGADPQDTRLRVRGEGGKNHVVCVLIAHSDICMETEEQLTWYDMERPTQHNDTVFFNVFWHVYKYC